MSNWIKVGDEKPEKYSYYWVKTEEYVLLSEWDGEDWVKLQPAYEYKLEDYCIDGVTYFQLAQAPSRWKL